MDSKGNTLEIGIMKLWAEHGWEVDEIRVSQNKWTITAGYKGLSSKESPQEHEEVSNEMRMWERTSIRDCMKYWK